MLWPPQGVAVGGSLGATWTQVALPTTSGTLFTYTPGQTLVLVARATVDVITAPTTVTLTLSWTDPLLGAQSYSWLNAANETVETHGQVPLVFVAAGGQPITLTGSASAADQAYVSGNLERLV